jgi:fatty-acid desaturase
MGNKLLEPAPNRKRNSQPTSDRVAEQERDPSLTVASDFTEVETEATAVAPSWSVPDDSLQGPDPRHPWRNGVQWPVLLFIGFVHVAALGAPFFFTWKALGLMLVMIFLTGCLGVCLGYHRLLTHGSFQTYPFVRRLLAFLGGLSGEGSAVSWVANHRKHHLHSDQEGDPHSPLDGGWWSHMLWIYPKRQTEYERWLTERFAPDLMKDPVMRFLDKTFIWQHLLLGAAFLSIGWIFWDFRTGMSFLMWGTFVRMIYVFHVTWFVNSATHMWGYRNYETTDRSRNLWWVGILAFGEGWHNNHHAYQRLAPHGHKWWEFDMTYNVICLMERLGLAWHIVRKIPPNAKPA